MRMIKNQFEEHRLLKKEHAKVVKLLPSITTKLKAKQKELRECQEELRQVKERRGERGKERTRDEDSEDGDRRKERGETQLVTQITSLQETLAKTKEKLLTANNLAQERQLQMARLVAKGKEVMSERETLKEALKNLQKDHNSTMDQQKRNVEFLQKVR